MATETQKDEILNWIFHGRVGISALAITARTLGFKVKAYSYPHDASDIGRCIKMLNECPSVDINVMKGFHHVWDKLVENWEQITTLYSIEEYRQVYELISKFEEPYVKNSQLMADDLIYA